MKNIRKRIKSLEKQLEDLYKQRWEVKEHHEISRILDKIHDILETLSRLRKISRATLSQVINRERNSSFSDSGVNNASNL